MGIKDYLQNRRKRKFKKRFKVGLCLSGGGTRGFAYLGVFKAFEELGITFDSVAGTSAGSLFGALYASKMSYDEIYKKTKDMKNSDFKKSKLGFLPSKMDYLRENLQNILPCKKIEDLPIEYRAVAVDLKSGKEIIFNKGDLPIVITASCAIPGVYYPVKYKDMNLVDGGVTNNVPIDVLKNCGCDYVVAVDCNFHRGAGSPSNNIITQFMTSIGIMMSKNSKSNLHMADILICPDTKRFSSLDLKDKDDMIAEGYKAVIMMKPQLEKLFYGKIKKKK